MKFTFVRWSKLASKTLTKGEFTIRTQFGQSSICQNNEGCLVKSGERTTRGYFQFASRTSELYAQRLINRLVARADLLGDFPEMGRINPKLQELEVRELIEAPYRIFYRIEREKVEIIGVVHGARDF